jgi:hypothetical protein
MKLFNWSLKGERVRIFAKPEKPDNGLEGDTLPVVLQILVTKTDVLFLGKRFKGHNNYWKFMENKHR